MYESSVEHTSYWHLLTLVMLNPDILLVSAFANSVDPDQLASEANRSGCALFAIKYVKK